MGNEVVDALFIQGCILVKFSLPQSLQSVFVLRLEISVPQGVSGMTSHCQLFSLCITIVHFPHSLSLSKKGTTMSAWWDSHTATSIYTSNAYSGH